MVVAIPSQGLCMNMLDSYFMEIGQRGWKHQLRKKILQILRCRDCISRNVNYRQKTNKNLGPLTTEPQPFQSGNERSILIGDRMHSCCNENSVHLTSRWIIIRARKMSQLQELQNQLNLLTNSSMLIVRVLTLLAGTWKKATYSKTLGYI